MQWDNLFLFALISSLNPLISSMIMLLCLFYVPWHILDKPSPTNSDISLTAADKSCVRSKEMCLFKCQNVHESYVAFKNWQQFLLNWLRNEGIVPNLSSSSLSENGEPLKGAGLVTKTHAIGHRKQIIREPSVNCLWYLTIWVNKKIM